MTPDSNTTIINVKLTQNPPKAKKMRWLVRSMILFLALVIIFCWIFYPVKYTFFKMTISDLGMFYNASFSAKSRWIFTIGFLIIAILILNLNVMYMKGTGFYHKTLKIIILCIFMLGAVGTAAPHNSDDFITGFLGDALTVMHFVGAGFFVGGFGMYNFVCQLLRYVRKKKQGQYPKKEGVSWKRKWDFWVDLVFVYLVIIAIVWYLISGVLGIFHVDKTGILIIFQTALSQKMVLFVAGAAAFLLDPDDI